MPCRCRSWDSRSPDGPPPMMQTCTFIFTTSVSRMSQVFLQKWIERSAVVMYNSNMQDDRTIDVYNLFGEAGDLPDVVHCETIPSRSVLHDWKLAPHRH